MVFPVEQNESNDRSKKPVIPPPLRLAEVASCIGSSVNCMYMCDAVHGFKVKQFQTIHFESYLYQSVVSISYVFIA